MITAEQARQNVYQKEIEDYKKTEIKVYDLLDELNETIILYSKNGFSTVTITPYTDENFPTIQRKEIASRIFVKVLEANGYTVDTNNWQDNILKIHW